MTAIGYSGSLRTEHNWWTEAREAMRDAMQSRAVAAVAIVCGTLVVLVFLGIMGWLLYTQRDATMLMTLVNTIVSVFLYKRLSDVDGRVRGVEKQTNGHTTRLMEAALKDKQQ